MEEFNQGIDLGDELGGGSGRKRPKLLMDVALLALAVFIILLGIGIYRLDAGLTERLEVLRNVTVSEFVTLTDRLDEVSGGVDEAVGQTGSRLVVVDRQMTDLSARVSTMSTLVTTGRVEVLAELVALREEVAELRSALASVNITVSAQVP